MLGYDLLPAFAFFAAGMLAGFSLSLLLNKLRTGSIDAGKLRQDMDDYQMQVEAHFEEASEKFKKVAENYQELYDHLSIGATSLCRPDHIARGLTDQSMETAASNDIGADTQNPEAKPAGADADASKEKANGGSIKRGATARKKSN